MICCSSFVVEDEHDLWWLVWSGSVSVGPEVAGEANPGVESPATGWAQVGECRAWDAGHSRLSQFTFLLYFGGPALYASWLPQAIHFLS